MKKFFLSLLLIHVSLNCFSLPWFSTPEPQPRKKVLVMRISDPIKFEDLQNKLYLATIQQKVVGVILVIDSNGGKTANFSVIHDMIKKLASRKPVVSLVTGSACSGGYTIASAANSVLAHSASMIGSIGAYSEYSRYSNAHVKYKDTEADVEISLFKAGEFKAIGNPYAPELTENQRAFIQEKLMKHYNAFIDMIVQNRHIKKDEYKEWAEGKTFYAPEALELGLIDGIGTIFDAEEKIKQLIVKCNPNFGSTDAIEFVY
jgi:protease-4